VLLVHSLAYLLPALLLLLALVLRRYPGERRLLQAIVARASRRRRPRRASIPGRARPRVLLPRGGRLLACSLAVRPPPQAGALSLTR
jgi:hypothetical protein